jgi:hypothetical protein
VRTTLREGHPRSLCPLTYPCPYCGRRGRRTRRLHRRSRSLAYQHEAWLDVTYAEYRARCRCGKRLYASPIGQALLDAFVGHVE